MPTYPGATWRPLCDRFWPKVNKEGSIPECRPELGPCWQWTAAKDRDGYGQIGEGGREGAVQAHRSAYELLVGPIPDGLVLDHLCRTPSCVNPSHLEPVTQAENVRRGYWGTRTHCVNGHEWDEGNTRSRPDGKRECRACHRIRERARRRRAATRKAA